MDPSHWLLKSEPETYSFQKLLEEKKTNWNGVRNFQARNYLATIQLGDLALIYHSGDEKAVVGIAKVIRAGYPDPDPKKPGDWVQIDLAPVQAFERPVSLKEIKGTSTLSEMTLVKQSRLSVMPISSTHYKILCKMGGLR